MESEPWQAPSRSLSLGPAVGSAAGHEAMHMIPQFGQGLNGQHMAGKRPQMLSSCCLNCCKAQAARGCCMRLPCTASRNSLVVSPATFLATQVYLALSPSSALLICRYLPLDRIRSRGPPCRHTDTGRALALHCWPLCTERLHCTAPRASREGHQ